MSAHPSTMTEDEWATIALLIEEGWPGEFAEASSVAWRMLLGDFSLDQVHMAIKTLVARGGRFRPSVAEVVAAIRQDPSAPTFEEAYRLIYGPGGIMSARALGAFAGPVEMARAEHEARVDRAREIGERAPLVASFALRYGLDRLAGLELDDPEWGELRRKELREAWDRHVQVMDGREIAALVSGRREEGLRALDPLAALGPVRPRLEAGQ